MDAEKVKRYIYKNQKMFGMVDTIKLWPSRSGVLHGVKKAELNGNMIEITTHCGEHFAVWDSKTSRSARWLRNRWSRKPCPKCGIPQWKLDKYASTVFTGDIRRMLK